MTTSSQPALIGVDWGTLSLRGYLMAEDGSILDAAAKPWSIQRLPIGVFPEAFRGRTDAWRTHDPILPVVAAGMVGSRQGWREVPYVECPSPTPNGCGCATGGLVDLTTQQTGGGWSLGVARKLPIIMGLLIAVRTFVGATALAGAVCYGLVVGRVERLTARGAAPA